MKKFILSLIFISFSLCAMDDDSDKQYKVFGADLILKNESAPVIKRSKPFRIKIDTTVESSYGSLQMITNPSSSLMFEVDPDNLELTLLENKSENINVLQFDSKSFYQMHNLFLNYELLNVDTAHWLITFKVNVFVGNNFDKNPNISLYFTAYYHPAVMDPFCYKSFVIWDKLNSSLSDSFFDFKISYGY